jgi:hypothetical protein
MQVLAAAEAEDAHPPSHRTGWLEGHRRDVPFAVLLAVTLVLCLILLRPGHDWGDDFALYINQARALVRGDVQFVLHQNELTVNRSAWQSFSPYTYGWGFPMLLAPLYAVFGLSYTAFKALEVALFLGFLTAFYALIRDRIDRLAALLIIAAVVLDNFYTAWTNVVLTEFPFMCFSVTTLLVIERLHAPRRVDAPVITRGYLIALAGLGALIGFTFNIRNEGAVLVLALAARQLAVLVPRWRDWLRRWRTHLPVLALPYVIAAVVGFGIRVILPTEQGDSLTLAGGLGGHNFATNDGFYRQTVAELLAFKDHIHGALLLGLIVFILVLAVGGMVLGGWRDLPLSVFTLGLSLIYFELPYREGRYLLAIIPFVLYFAMQGLRGLDVPGWTIQPRHLLLLLVVATHSLGMANAADYWRTYPKAIEGPESPLSKDMFAAVDEYVQPGQIVVFFRPRALNLYTDHAAITAGSSLPIMLQRGDWYAMAKESDYAQCALTDAEAAATGRMTKVWENEAWVLWRIDHDTTTAPPIETLDVQACAL